MAALVNAWNNFWSKTPSPVNTILNNYKGIIIAGGLGATGATVGPLAAVAVAGVAAGGMYILDTEDEKIANIGKHLLGSSGAMALATGSWQLVVRPIVG